MNRRSLLLFALGILLATRAAPADLRHESKHLGLIFRYPQDFLVGRPVEDPLSKKTSEALAKMGKESIPPDRVIRGLIESLEVVK